MDNLQTVERVDAYTTLRTTLETTIDSLWWQLRGLSYTATGYGHKIPTKYKVIPSTMVA